MCQPSYSCYAFCELHNFISAVRTLIGAEYSPSDMTDTVFLHRTQPHRSALLTNAVLEPWEAGTSPAGRLWVSCRLEFDLRATLFTSRLTYALFRRYFGEIYDLNLSFSLSTEGTNEWKKYWHASKFHDWALIQLITFTQHSTYHVFTSRICPFVLVQWKKKTW